MGRVIKSVFKSMSVVLRRSMACLKEEMIKRDSIKSWK